jgi:hypothetical protein
MSQGDAAMNPGDSGMVKAFIDALNRRPFAPFKILTRNGKKYPVTRLAQAGTNGTDAAVIDNKDVLTWFKTTDIVGIEPIESPRRGASRGKS